MDRGKFVKQKIGLKSVFLAWKREYLVSRRVAHKTNAFASSLLNFSLQSAFDMIRAYSHTKNHSTINKKRNGKEKLIAAFQ